MDEQLRIALLIDADNAPASKIDVVLEELARHGIANVRRAYGNWKSPNLQKWEAALHPNAIQPMQQFALSTGKNASDMAMVVDAMDLLHAGRFDAFAIVSSDADFTPLVMRLRAQNMRVFGFGEKKSPEPFVKACSTFLFLEKLDSPNADPAKPTSPQKPKTSSELRGDAYLMRLFRGAVGAVKGEDGWAFLGAVGTQIRNQASFDERNYGYSNLSGLIEAINFFEIRRNGQLVYVREKPAKQSAASSVGPAKIPTQ